jgi:hypothetical protein
MGASPLLWIFSIDGCCVEMPEATPASGAVFVCHQAGSNLIHQDRRRISNPIFPLIQIRI